MKLNKEMILKHKFWVMLLVVVPMSLMALTILATSVSGEISSARTDIEKKLKTLKTNRTIKTPAQIAAVRREADIEKSKEKVIWGQAFGMQEPLLFWPKEVEDEFNFRSGLFAEKIQVKKAEAAGENAKDEERVLHGEVIEQKVRHIKVRTNDKKVHVIHPTRDVTVVGADGLLFGTIEIGTRVTVNFHKGKYFNEPLTEDELEVYKRPKVYESQIDPIIYQLDPLTEKGDGVVQLPTQLGWWFYKKGELPPSYTGQEQSFLNFLDKGWEDAPGDITEEAWLAQENLWIQSEIFHLIRMSNDYVSKFEGEGGKDKNKEYTFKNPYWEMKVKWDGNHQLIGTLKNLLGRSQKLGLSFRVRTNESMKSEKSEIHKIGGEPVGPRGSRDKGDERSFTITLSGGENSGLHQGIFGVEQVLNWETAAVKRIDQVSVGSMGTNDLSHGHRTYPEGLQALKAKEKDVNDLTKPPPPKRDVGFSPGKGKGGKKKSLSRDQGTNDLTKKGLIRNQFYNYFDLSVAPDPKAPLPQFRRIPVGVVLIVEQDHIDRVLTAFNNSKLRFLTTQVLLNRYPETLKPILPAADPNAAGGGGAPPPTRTGRPALGSSSTTADSMETNIELVLYGMVTLYERYPPLLQAGP